MIPVSTLTHLIDGWFLVEQNIWTNHLRFGRSTYSPATLRQVEPTPATDCFFDYNSIVARKLGFTYLAIIEGLLYTKKSVYGDLLAVITASPSLYGR